MMFNSKVDWKNPIIKAIINHYDGKYNIIEIIDFETEKLIEKYINKNYSIQSLPIENIAASLNVSKIHTYFDNRNIDTVTRSRQGGYSIAVSKKHYYYYRYALAHEISHLLLRKFAGPISKDNLSSNELVHKEEEAVCDYFATSILVPSSKLKDELQKTPHITLDLINKLSKKFSVSKKIMINRIAQVNNFIVLYWDKIINPNKEKSRELLRINDVYPNRVFFAKYYIPKFCTANSKRFFPNLILDSYHQSKSNDGLITVLNLGQLPNGHYHFQNIFISHWDSSFFEKGLIRTRNNFYSLISLVHI